MRPARTSAPSGVIQYIDDKCYVVWPKAQAAARAGAEAAGGHDLSHK